MSNEALDAVDPTCADFKSLSAELSTANPIIDEATGLAFVEKVNELARQHRTTCVQCQAYRGASVAEDQRSAIWGGATLGLLVGLLIGFFRESYWQTVVYAVLIGAGFGPGAELLARVGNALLRRK